MTDREQVLHSVRTFLDGQTFEGQPNVVNHWEHRGGHDLWNDCFEVEGCNGHYWAERYKEAHPEHSKWISSGAVALVVQWKPEPDEPDFDNMTDDEALAWLIATEFEEAQKLTGKS